MNSSTITSTNAPDQSEKARQLIELGLAMDPDARSATLARLIASSVHSSHHRALRVFADTGELDAQGALDELNEVRVPFEQEAWLDALGAHILSARRRP